MLPTGDNGMGPGHVRVEDRQRAFVIEPGHPDTMLFEHIDCVDEVCNTANGAMLHGTSGSSGNGRA